MVRPRDRALALLVAAVWIGGVAAAIHQVTAGGDRTLLRGGEDMLVVSADRLCDGGEGDVIYTMSLDGSNLRSLTRRGPFAPPEELSGVVDAAPKGSDPRCLSFTVAGAFLAQHPVWSPDGGRIAYTGAFQGPQHDGTWIYTMAPDGSARRKLVEADGPLDWSPDGARIVSAYGAGIVIVDGTTGGSQEIGIFEDVERAVSVEGVSWAPDGERVALTTLDLMSAFTGDCSAGDSGLFTVPVDGGEPEPFGEPGCYLGPAWSPDGATIAVTAYSGDAGGSRIALVMADGMAELAPCRRADDCRQAAAAWSPDGSRIAFLEEGRIVIVNTDGSFVGEIALPRRLWVTDLDWGVVRLAAWPGRG